MVVYALGESGQEIDSLCRTSVSVFNNRVQRGPCQTSKKITYRKSKYKRPGALQFPKGRVFFWRQKVK